MSNNLIYACLIEKISKNSLSIKKYFFTINNVNI